jgi:surface carbohydrate biosynthesis protein
MKNIKILWLIEHIAREMDVACAVKTLVKSKSGIDIIIKHIYLHANNSMRTLNPEMIVFPFFYKSSDLAIAEYIKRWPNAIYVNLAWEQIFYKANLKIKAPSDEITKNNVNHIVWGNFYKEFLIKNGVTEKNIFINGNPVYALYKKPYSSFFNSRKVLAVKYSLDPEKRWIFVPENYRWAFVADAKIKRLAKDANNENELYDLKSFCIKSLDLLWKSLNRFALENNVEIIFRPRPATQFIEMERFALKSVNKLCKNIRILKDETTRDWVMSSDVIMSSFSTTLIEAAVADKDIYMFEPINFPEGLKCSWYSYIPTLRSYRDFGLLNAENIIPNSKKLKVWAEDEMYLNNDPFRSLSEIILQLNDRSKRENKKVSVFKELNLILNSYLNNKNYFNRLTHENDIFSDLDISLRIKKWNSILNK